MKNLFYALALSLCFVATAYAGLGLNLGLTQNVAVSEGGGSSDYLDGVITGMVFEVDATDANSYPGTGTKFFNLIETPADGETQSTYDFNFLNTPNFNGTAGDAGAYFNFDAGDGFTLAANTTFTNRLHWTTSGSDFTMLFAVESLDDTWANGSLLSTANSGTSQRGIRTLLNTNETLVLGQAYASGLNQAAGSISPVTTGDIFAAVSHSHSANETTIWLCSSTGEVFSHTFTTNTDDATHILQLAIINSSFVLPITQYRLRSAAMANKVLSNSEMALAITNWEARHGLDYTP